MIVPDQIYTSRQLETLLQLGKDTLKRMRRLGEGPPGIQIGRLWRYRGAEVIAWLDPKLATGKGA